MCKSQPHRWGKGHWLDCYKTCPLLRAGPNYSSWDTAGRGHYMWTAGLPEARREQDGYQPAHPLETRAYCRCQGFPKTTRLSHLWCGRYHSAQNSPQPRPRTVAVSSFGLLSSLPHHSQEGVQILVFPESLEHIHHGNGNREWLVGFGLVKAIHFRYQTSK